MQKINFKVDLLLPNGLKVLPGNAVIMFFPEDVLLVAHLQRYHILLELGITLTIALVLARS